MAYRDIRVAASLGLCAGALMLAACTGKVLSLGTNSTQAQEVAPSAVGGSVPACSGGSAHPNVCCSAGPNQAGSCVTYPSAPFTQCDPGATTYPDPRSCCALDGSGNCSSPPSSGGSGSSGGSTGSGSGSGGSCAYACPPGSYSMSSSFGSECCTTDSNGGTACSGGGSAGGSSGASGSSGGCSGSCSCPACDDGGVCPPCECPPTTCQPTTCGACPPGWQAPQGAPDLCCATDSSGNIECFSQAVPPGQIGSASDGGTGPSGGSCSVGASVDGAIGPCSCQEQTGGHTYAVSCDPTVCTCTTDNGAPSSTFTVIGNTCSDPTTLFTSCGFPQ